MLGKGNGAGGCRNQGLQVEAAHLGGCTEAWGMWCPQQRCWGVLAASHAATPNISNGPEHLYLGNQIQPEVAWSCSALLVSHHFPSGSIYLCLKPS